MWIAAYSIVVGAQPQKLKRENRIHRKRSAIPWVPAIFAHYAVSNPDTPSNNVRAIQVKRTCESILLIKSGPKRRKDELS